MSSTPDSAQPVNEGIGPDVKIPGPYPTGKAPNSREAAEAVSHQSEPTDTSTEHAASLGDLTKDVSTSTVPEDSGGLGSPSYDTEEPESS